VRIRMKVRMLMTMLIKVQKQRSQTGFVNPSSHRAERPLDCP
jgi:hypothetical protein